MDWRVRAPSSPDRSEDRRIVWPPKLILQTPLGYLRDASGNFLPRDIGVSSVLSDGTVLFQFGDTFCHSLGGDYLGCSTNTCSVLEETNSPTLSSYFTIKDQNGGGRSSEQQVPAFLPMIPGEGDTETHMFKIWCFSGIVETGKTNDGTIHGICYYEAREIEKGTNAETAYLYTGMAPMVWNKQKKLLEATRRDEDGTPKKQFLSSEPRFGAFCAVRDRDRNCIYLYGHTPDEKKSVVLARVPVGKAYYRHEHQYWDGKKWSCLMRDAKPVFSSMQHGQIFQTKMFGRESVWKWAFIGCTCFADSKVMMGRAKDPQGPWELHFVEGFKSYRHVDAPQGYLYCFYPHPWAFDGKKGDLMISWSEGGLRGNVIVDLLRVETEVVPPQYRY